MLSRRLLRIRNIFNLRGSTFAVPSLPGPHPFVMYCTYYVLFPHAVTSFILKTISNHIPVHFSTMNWPTVIALNTTMMEGHHAGQRKEEHPRWHYPIHSGDSVPITAMTAQNFLNFSNLLSNKSTLRRFAGQSKVYTVLKGRWRRGGKRLM